MHRQSRAGRFLAVLVVVLITASVGFWAYRVGFAHGVSQGIAMNLAAAGPEAGKALPNAAPYPYAYPYGHPYGWHGPWGWGWGFFPFGFLGPLFFLAFWFFVLRMLLWGGPWRRGPWHRGGWRGGPWGRRGWYDDGRGHDDVDAPSRHARL